eukprot:scaffold56185_cov47-Phaeocystis_antarctica.AAC.1
MHRRGIEIVVAVSVVVVIIVGPLTLADRAEEDLLLAVRACYSVYCYIAFTTEQTLRSTTLLRTLAGHAYSSCTHDDLQAPNYDHATTDVEVLSPLMHQLG